MVDRIKLLKALMRAWEAKASRHDKAMEECGLLSPSDEYEAAMHGEAARVYRECAGMLDSLVTLERLREEAEL